MTTTAAPIDPDTSAAMAPSASALVRLRDSGMTGAEMREARDPDTLAALIRRVRAEFIEMPGMQLTLPQAARLWGLDPTTCDHILGVLAGSGFLTKRDGRYARASGH